MAQNLSYPSRTQQPASSKRRLGPVLPVWQWLSFAMISVVGTAAAVHHAAHGIVNGWHLTLVFFLAINLLVCAWEVALGARIQQIEDWHHDPVARRHRPRGLVFGALVTPGELLSFDLWARVWSEYATYDAGYADRRSFGFAIDVGNGWSTAIPSLLLLAGMTTGSMSPVALGLIGALVFYQKIYGTLLYFFSFIFNRRYEGHPIPRVVAVVGGTNGLWLVFPALGMYVCLRLIFENSFDVLWT